MRSLAMRVVLAAWCALSGCAGDEDEGDANSSNAGVGAEGEPDPALVQSCRRFCVLAEVFQRGECTPGDAYEHGVPLGDPVPAEPPVSDDQTCIDDCMRVPEGLCWQQVAAANECNADILWTCNSAGSWVSQELCEAGQELCEQ